MRIEFDAWQRLNWALAPVFVAALHVGVAGLTAQAGSAVSVVVTCFASGVVGAALGFGMRSAFGMAAWMEAGDAGLRIKPLGFRERRFEWSDVLALSIHRYDPVHSLYRLRVDVATSRGGAAYSITGKRVVDIMPFLHYAASQVRRVQDVPLLGPLLSVRSQFAFRQAGAFAAGIALCAVPAFLWKPEGGLTAMPAGCMTVCAAAVAVIASSRLGKWRAHHDGRTWIRGEPPPFAGMSYRSAGPRLAREGATPEPLPEALALFADALVAALPSGLPRANGNENRKHERTSGDLR